MFRKEGSLFMKEQPNYKINVPEPEKSDVVIENIKKSPNCLAGEEKIHVPLKLLDAARKLLEEDGIKGLSMMNISKAAGVSEATVYKYFQ